MEDKKFVEEEGRGKAVGKESRTFREARLEMELPPKGSTWTVRILATGKDWEEDQPNRHRFRG